MRAGTILIEKHLQNRFLQDYIYSTISEHSPHANILSQDVVDLICPHSCVIEGHEYVKLEKLHNFVSNFSLINAVSYFSDVMSHPR